MVNKDPVEVFCRIRPSQNSNEKSCVVPVDSCTLKLTPPTSSFAFRNGTAKEQQYRFCHVFEPTTNQKELFDTTAKPLVQDLLNGKNGLLFAYGITGSGKTYTMEGSPQDGGILRRTIDVIFNSVSDLQARKFTFKPDKMNGFDLQFETEATTERFRADNFQGIPKTPRHRYPTRRDISGSTENSRVRDTFVATVDEDNAYAIFVNYIEIYNNYVYDLLEEISENNMTKDLQSKILREDANHNMYIHGCTEVEVRSPKDAFKVLQKGQSRRKVAQTHLNRESSRSHSIFTIRVVQAPFDENGEEILNDKSAIVVSQVSLVDLAGSERNKRTKATGDRIKEAGNINNSLMALRECIQALKENQNHSSSALDKIIPYRKSKLTHFLKTYFEGKGKVRMIVCVNTSEKEYDETLPVMQFAELASVVEISCPTPATNRQDLGLPAGRRRANKVFKDARKKLQEEGLVQVKDLPIDIKPIYTLGPSWPPVEYTDENIEEMTLKLIDFLRTRIENKQNMLKGFIDDVAKFRTRIVKIEEDLVLSRQEASSFKSLYHDSVAQNRSLEMNLINSNSAYEMLCKKVSDYNRVIDDYKLACEERDLAKSQGQLEKQRMKSRLKAKLESEREKMMLEMNGKIEKHRKQMEKEIYSNQMKALQQMYDPNNEIKKNPRIPPNMPRTPLIKQKTDIQSTDKGQENQHGANVGGGRHRRSMSQGANLWLDHRPNQVLETPLTVHQANLPRRKSVRRLSTDDLTSDKKKFTHYCLTTEDKDSEGDLGTKMYKGDVLKTVTGGSQVVFNDVEILRQKSLENMKKRDINGTPKLDQASVQERCTSNLHTTPIKSVYTRNTKRYRI